MEENKQDEQVEARARDDRHARDTREHDDTRARDARERKDNTQQRTTSNGLSDLTQIGQVLRNITNATRQLTTELPRHAQRRSQSPGTRPVANSALRERIALLIAALGDPSHAMHQQAIEELVRIGDPAVPALNEALNPRRPWLTIFRAAEALGQIGDGRATGPLIDTLHHSNSNVRWSAVRALAAIGDARALLELRRVAREDRGKTSWGESVAGAAQSAIDQMRSQNVLLRSAELLQTAVACVLMLVALILAWSVITSLRSELQQVGRESVTPIPQSAAQASGETATDPDTSAAPTSAPTPEASPTVVPTSTPVAQITGRVLSTANVRAFPSVETGERIGLVNAGDEIIFEATNESRDWYRVRLGSRVAPGSRIDSADGTGWVSGSLLSRPSGDLPVE